MASIDYADMLLTAKENFISGNYKLAEPMLKQLLLVKNRDPEVYQMLATIFYDQGKFKRAIKTFKRALEIDPGYTDASIGLSIILNDIGKYDEAKNVFEDAREFLDKKKSKLDSYAEEKISQKHFELGEMYSNYKMFKEVIEQYQSALRFANEPSEIVVRIADAYVANREAEKAVKFLHKHLDEFPTANPVRVKLGLIYYNGNRILEAAEEWEKVLKFDPKHSDAKSYLKLAQNIKVTERPL